MKKVLLFLLLLLAGIGEIRAGFQEKILGLGFFLGAPSGISFKMWTSDIGAIDGAVAWEFGRRDILIIYVDFLKHNFEKFHVRKGSLPFYYGIGTRLKIAETKEKQENKLGIRGVAGIAYILETRPVEVFFELAPVLDIIPTIELEAAGGMGIRFYF